MTIYDIAREANVSASTVSRVMNGRPGIKAQTREKVKSIMEKYNFEPDETARGLVLQSSKTIGLLIADVRIAYYMYGVHSIINEFAKHGYCCILLSSGVTSKERADYIKVLSQRKVEGAILIGSSYQCDEVCEAISFYMSNIPVIILDGTLDMPNVYGMLYDVRRGVERCVDFLLNKNRHHLAFISGSHTVSNGKRLAGFQDSLRSHGLDDNVLLLHCSENDESGYIVTRQLIDEHPDTDAILYSSDCFAVPGIRALIDIGKRVPDDVAVISSEDSFYSTLSHPLVTSLDGKFQEMCNIACKNMLELLNDHPVPKLVELVSNINERETT